MRKRAYIRHYACAMSKNCRREPLNLPLFYTLGTQDYNFSIPRPAIFNLIMSADGTCLAEEYKGTCACDDL
jgi:hypothetical protein